MADQQAGVSKGYGSWALLFSWFLMGIGLPGAVAGLDRRWVATHLPMFIILCFLSLLGPWLAGVAQEVWRRRYKDLVIDWIGSSIDRRAGFFWQKYRTHLLADLRYVDLGGLTGRFFDPELSDVFVDVALRPGDPRKMRSSDLAGADLADLADLPETGQRQRVEDFLGRPQPRVLAIIGAPGTGKTTLLRHTARAMCLSRRVSRHGRNIPILLHLRDHFARIVAEPTVALPALVAEDLALYGLIDRADWLEHRLRAGDCVVMLDGLDEVARQEDRHAVAEWFRVQVIRYSRNDFVVTSRPLGYQGAHIEGAIIVQPQPFTREQVTKFLHRWCLAEERRSAGADDERVASRAAQDADDLLARLQAAPALHSLAVNPLLLTMIAIVHRHYGALPGSRAELYARICQVLLWSRQDAKKLKLDLRGSQKERLMRLLAFEMMRRKVRDLPTTEVTAILAPVLKRMNKTLPVRDVLYDADSNGLLVERENGVRGFAHQTFQEFLAAAHIKEEKLEEILVNAVDDVWWREATLLYVAGADAGPIVESCLAAGTPAALALAFDCADEAGELSSDLEDRLAILRSGGFTRGADPEHRRAVTGATLTRHLRQVTEIGEGTRICSQPINAAIYRFFLEDMAERGQARPPDRLELTAPDAVVTGVRASDAAAFVHWVNEVTGVNEVTDGRSAYRLPVLSEIRDLPHHEAFTVRPDSSPGHHVWVAPEHAGDPARLYPLVNGPLPGSISGAQLSQQLEADFASAPLALGILPLMVHSSVAARILGGRRGVDLPHSVESVFQLLDNLADALEPEGAGDLSLAMADVLADSAERDLGNVRAVIRDIEDGLSPDPRAIDVRAYVNLIAARKLSRTVDRDLRLICGFARMLREPRPGGLVQGDFELACNLELASSLKSSRDADIDVASEIESDGASRLSHRGARTGVTGAARGAKRDHDLERIVSSHFSAASRPVIGNAIVGMLAQLPEHHGPVPDLAEMTSSGTRFARQFAEIAAIGSGDYGVAPDSLADTTRSALTQLNEQLGDARRAESAWAGRVSDRFASLMEGVLVREQRVEAPIGLSLRIMALCLAVEADALGLRAVGHDFRQIAAAVTWLQLRHSGAEPAIEAIVLACG